MLDNKVLGVKLKIMYVNYNELIADSKTNLDIDMKATL